MQEPLPIHFAPLQGYTETAYRNAHAACFEGVDTYYTPFVRLEKGNFRNKDLREAEPANNHVPRLIPQLIASTPEVAETILQRLAGMGHREVDINLGCPFPLLAKRHNGSGILPYPAEVEALLGVTARHPEISFSVKMRLGWENPDECLRLAPILNETPLRHVTLHPRLGRQQYKGEADLEGFEAFRQACRQPLIYNGDIATPQDIRSVHERFPDLAGVMIGRGLLANPALAWEYRQGEEMEPEEKRRRIAQMHRLVLRSYKQQLEGGDAQLLMKMKAFWEYLLLPKADRKLQKAIRKSSSIDKYMRALREHDLL